MVSSTVSTRHRKLLAVAAFPFVECAAAGGSTAPAVVPVDAAGCPIAKCDCQFSRQCVYNLALLCHRQSRARRRRQTGSIAIDSAAGLPVAALAALVSETPRTISGEQLAMKLKLPHDKWFEWFEPLKWILLSIKYCIQLSSSLCVQFQSLVRVEISPQTMRLSICDYLSDSVRSKMN